MGELRSFDGKFICVDQGDRNFVVYLASTMQPVWDRWSWEAAQTETQQLEPAAVVESHPIGTGQRLIRITSEADGEFINRQYSYWPTAYIKDDTAYVFVGHADGNPRFFAVDLTSGAVSRMGPMLPYWGTAEGWYWDAQGWIYLLDGPTLHYVNPFTADDRLVFSIENSHPGCRLWQAHSSDDGLTHSATVQEVVETGAYPNLGTVVFRRGREHYFPAIGSLDESQIDASGRWLIIKEDDRNRIIDLDTRATITLSNADGAVGHSDCGDGILVGEDDQHGACVRWDLREPLTPERRQTLFNTWAMGHVSIRGGRCLLSDEKQLSLVALDGSGVTPLLEHGMSGRGYDYQVFGNLDPTGRVASFMSNRAGRMDAYLLVL